MNYLIKPKTLAEKLLLLRSRIEDWCEINGYDNMGNQAVRKNEDGSWDEPEFTGTGFPGYGIGMRPGSSDQFNGKQQDIALPAGFMINYHMYRIYWPLCALGRFRAWNANRDSHH